MSQTVIVNTEVNKGSHQRFKESNRSDNNWEGYREYLSNVYESKNRFKINLDMERPIRIFLKQEMSHVRYKYL
jgi:hypothetical protein